MVPPATLLRENVSALQGDNHRRVNYHVSQDGLVQTASFNVTVITVGHVTRCRGRVYAVQHG